jgi:hypothetical protein
VQEPELREEGVRGDGRRDGARRRVASGVMEGMDVVESRKEGA